LPTATAPTARRNWPRIVADIATKVQHLDIAMAENSDGANVLVKLVREPRPSIAPSHNLLWRRAAARRDQDPRWIRNACPVFRKNEKFEIEHSDVILTIDNGDFRFPSIAPTKNCCSRSGPINDTSSVPWTMFQRQCVRWAFFFGRLRPIHSQRALRPRRVKAGHDRAGSQGGGCRMCSPTCGPWVKKVNDLAE